MTHTAKKASLKGFNKDLFWKIVYFVGLFTICIGFYAATEQADYIWRWNRLPIYFYYVYTINLDSDIEG
jgi:polar amino acid transport system permease protein